MGRKRDAGDEESLDDLIADVELCREKMADVERRLKALNARYLIDTPLVRAAGQVKSAQDAIMEALERKRPAPPRRRRR